MKSVAFRVLCGLLPLSAAPALAQSSTLVGTVINVQGQQPVQHVIVTVASPHLRDARTVLTDAEGNYRIPKLPPGVYTLRFEKEPFQPYVRTEVQLRLNRTLRVNAALIPASLGEEEAQKLTRALPSINLDCLSAPIPVDPEFVKRIAMARPAGKGGPVRSFESLAELAPRAQTDTYGVALRTTSHRVRP